MNHAFNVQSLRDKRAELEKQLTAAIKPLLDNFHTETGLSPSVVEVRLNAVWPIGCRNPVHVLESVRVTLDL